MVHLLGFSLWSSWSLCFSSFGVSAVDPMTIHVSLPAQFAELAGGAEELEVEGATVGEVLQRLAAQHPPFRPLLWRDGQPNPVIVLFVNDKQLSAAAAPSTPLQDGDRLLLLSAVEGG
jgi:molybdopterin synthase sulfur carrier subunit